MISTLSSPWSWLRRALPGMALGVALGAFAQVPASTPGDSLADIGPLTQRWLDDALQRVQAGGSALRMEVVVGTLDPRLRLAPCARVEPYLPAGARLWGRTRLGLRCVEGQVQWNVFLPVTIKAWGPAWVLAGNVQSGKVLTAADAVQDEVDWAAESAAVLANQESWVGQVASRQLLAGQALRQSMVRPAEVFKKGATVKVLVRGPGYAVTTSGQAVTGAGIGQSVKIRMDNGRLISGTVNAQGEVEVGP